MSSTPLIKTPVSHLKAFTPIQSPCKKEGLLAGRFKDPALEALGGIQNLYWQGEVFMVVGERGMGMIQEGRFSLLKTPQPETKIAASILSPFANPKTTEQYGPLRRLFSTEDNVLCRVHKKALELSFQGHVTTLPCWNGSWARHGGQFYVMDSSGDVASWNCVSSNVIEQYARPSNSILKEISWFSASPDTLFWGKGNEFACRAVQTFNPMTFKVTLPKPIESVTKLYGATICSTQDSLYFIENQATYDLPAILSPRFIPIHEEGALYFPGDAENRHQLVRLGLETQE